MTEQIEAKLLTDFEFLRHPDNPTLGLLHLMTETHRRHGHRGDQLMVGFSQGERPLGGACGLKSFSVLDCGRAMALGAECLRSVLQGLRRQA